MAISAELVGAVAASAAAILSGITLWLTNSREERKWRRDALVDIIVQLLDASFNMPDTMAFHTRTSGGDLKDIRTKTTAAHDNLASALTRLRVLASPVTVEKAELLHSVEDRVIDTILSGNDEDLLSDEQWESITQERDKARTALLDVSRQSLGLGKARPVALERARPTGI